MSRAMQIRGLEGARLEGALLGPPHLQIVTERMEEPGPELTRSFIWGSMLMGVVGYVNQKPMRQSKDASSPLMTLG